MLILVNMHRNDTPNSWDVEWLSHFLSPMIITIIKVLGSSATKQQSYRARLYAAAPPRRRYFISLQILFPIVGKCSWNQAPLRGGEHFKCVRHLAHLPKKNALREKDCLFWGGERDGDTPAEVVKYLQIIRAMEMENTEIKEADGYNHSHPSGDNPDLWYDLPGEITRRGRTHKHKGWWLFMREEVVHARGRIIGNSSSSAENFLKDKDRNGVAWL